MAVMSLSVKHVLLANTTSPSVQSKVRKSAQERETELQEYPVWRRCLKPLSYWKEREVKG
jgi:hypothetical protein